MLSFANRRTDKSVQVTFKLRKELTSSQSRILLKCVVVDNIHDYLYGKKFEVKSENNPSTYILTTAKLDATGHRQLPALFAFDFTMSYKSGKTNAVANALIVEAL